MRYKRAEVVAQAPRLQPKAASLAALLIAAACSDERNLSDHAAIALTPAHVSVSSVDVYKDGDAIHLLTGESHSEKGTPTLQYRRTTGGGVTWSEPVRVDHVSPPPHGLTRGMDAQIAGAGNDIVAAWSTAGAGWGGGGPLTTAISSDDGRSWRPGSNPADDNTTTGHNFADIVASREGFDMVWLDERHGKQGLRHAHSTDGGKQWGRNATLDAETCECCWNTLAHDSHGALCALYRDVNPRDMALATLGEGNVWERRGTAGKFDWDIDACPHTGGGLAVFGEVLHAAVWTGKEGALGVYHTHSNDGGVTWSEPRQVGDATASHPDIAASSDGNIAIVWDGHADDAQSSSILAASSNDGGRHWSAISQLSAPGVRASHPRIVAVHGRFKVFWTEGKERYRLMMRDMF